MILFRKVLVANRGEIACRVLRTLRRLGIASVAVYHREDRNAPHVAMADEAIRLDGPVPSGAYLDRDQIIAACRSTGAKAIHPGYGFLSENAGFAEAVEAAGLAFIGPGADVIRLMGDKIRSREFAAGHGVPVAPSVTEDEAGEAFLARAVAIGFPLLIKASAGGGGKGMKIVRNTAELAENAALARSEASRYFGDPRIFAERLVEEPRHIEVQVMGDGNGNVVHFYERECSLQRRYQKIVEEAPAPNLPAALRDRICAAAVRLAAAANYRNAGTVEFILGADGEFYFLEMNTRLQVEHPVTEMVTGIDLVEEQIRIAAGQGLSFVQEQIRIAGSAIECRICAEEPDRDFRPATGRIALLDLPSGEGIRFDGGILAKQAVTPAFDSMLAKLIAHGPSRADAVKRLERALEQTAVLGVPTNLDYLLRIVRHPAFQTGRLHTGFLTLHAEDLSAPPADSPTSVAALIAAALGDKAFRDLAFGIPEPHATIGLWRN
ncbi:MAG TPA: biotin carboxylase N-terminal domain-containing protein [Aliidongia sp.]|uniref:acetyl-CoA carboxylase biotin carboxylase subunit n=1 Tax=Aliidongia sp. TaxID=1914230 RepID=UPI002DDCFBBC|nr:biotin carboxylase N-terminal domain-containing protein [Aliidongia sp.]HEV2677546.1 biotin carboxylase N-terminal domain-containing protein [Aliidongia sp.]